MQNILIKQKAKLSYTDYLAYSLIHFSDTHPSFRSWFLGRIRRSTSVGKAQLENVPHIKVHTFSSEQVAVRKAEWLLELLQSEEKKSHIRTLTILSTWEKENSKEEPHFIILGLKYGVLDFGIFGEPSKFHEPLDIIIRENSEYARTSTLLLQESVRLGMTVVEQGLLHAHGDVTKLEPELHDWLFGEKNTTFYTCSQETIQKIIAEMQEIKSPIACTYDEHGPAVLAISPTMYVNDLHYASELQIVE